LSEKPNLFGRIWILLLIVFVDMVGFGIIIPYLPFWGERYGATPDLVALLMTVYAGFQFVFAFPLGWVSDNIGRKPVLALSVAGSVVSFGLLAVANSLWLIFLSRALGGVVGANISVAQAYIADVTDQEERAKGMGLLGAALGLGFILGPALGGVLAGSDAGNPDYRLTFWVAAAISGASLLTCLFIMREPARRRAVSEERGFRARLRAFGVVVSEPGVAIPIVVAGIAGFAMAGLESTYALWTNREHGWGPQANGWFFAYIGIVLVIVQGGLVGRIAKRFGEARMLMAGLVILMLGMAIVPLSVYPWLVYVNGGLIGIGFGMCSPALNSLTSRNAPTERQGAVMGVLQSAQSLARVAGPAFAGALFARWGHNSPYIASAAILVLVIVLVSLRFGRLTVPAR
jgi:DHA1 family tetracycline resistance protein-like MFS transporter